jgi:hypothetical protein
MTHAQPSSAPPVVYVATGNTAWAAGIFGSWTNYASWQTDSISSPGFEYVNSDASGDSFASNVKAVGRFEGSDMTLITGSSMIRVSCCCTLNSVASNNTLEVWVRGAPGTVRYNLRVTQRGASVRSVSPATPQPESPFPGLTATFNGQAAAASIQTLIDDTDASAGGPTREFPQYPGVIYTRARVVKADTFVDITQGFCSCCGCCAGGNYAASTYVDVTTTFDFDVLCESPTWLEPPGGGLSAAPHVAIPLPGGDVVAGGDFNFAGGPAVNNVASWDGASWSGFGVGLGPGVEAIAALPNGDVVVGGTFTRVGSGQSISRIARWNGTSWLPLGSGIPNGTVRAMVVLPNGHLVVGGSFSTAGGVTVNNIARWDGTTWSSLGSGLSSSFSTGVGALAVLPNGQLVAGGDFTSVGGVTVNGIARWDGTTWSALGAGVQRSTGAGEVRSLAVLPNGDLVAGGIFTRAGQVLTNNIARWNGSAWGWLGAGLTHPVSPLVRSLAVAPNGRLIAAGQFTTSGSTTVNQIAEWNGVSWSALGTGLTAPGYGFAVAVLPNGDIVAGGSFAEAGGVPVSNIARWNGTSWDAMKGGVASSVTALAVAPSGRLLVGGSFGSAGAVRANFIARWNGTSWMPLGSGTSGTVRSLLALPNGDIVAGGWFTQAGGVLVDNVARWDGTNWTPLGSGFTASSPGVRALALLPNGDIVAGGRLTTSNGVAVNNIARWDGTAWRPMGSGFNSTVSALAVLPNGDLVAGGSFSSTGGQPVNQIARWDGTSWLAMGSGMSGAVQDLVVTPSGDLLAGGPFLTAGGVPVNMVARWNGSSWSSPVEPLSGTFNAQVFAVAVLRSGAFVLGGEFTRTSAITLNRIGRSSGASWSPMGSGVNAGLDGSVNDLVTRPNGEVLVFGNFLTAGNIVSRGFAIWSPGCNECRGDLDQSSAVDDADFSIFVVAYDILDCTDPVMPVGCPADLNADNVVDDVDFSLFVVAYDALVCP